VNLSNFCELIGMDRVSSYLNSSHKLFSNLVTHDGDKYGTWEQLVGILFLRGASML
jgi:hypothetical protein